MPEDFGISELGAVDINDRVTCVCLEGVASVGAVRYILRLHAGGSRVGCDRVDRNDTVILIWEEAAGVVDIDNR